MKQYYVYTLSSRRNGTLHIGVTGDLIKRAYQHKHGLVEGFTKKYDVHNLTYYETDDSVYEALSRENQFKKWKRQWKIELIESMNQEWKDLYYDLVG
jgi:putative endonuclease